MKFVFTFFALVTASLIAQLPVQALTYTYSETVDAASASILRGSSGDSLNLALPSATIPVQVGDTVTGTISFENNQAVLLSGNTATSSDIINLEFAATPASSGSSYVINNYTIQLNGIDGQLSASNPFTSLSSGGAVAASWFQFYPNETDFSFTSLSYSITLTTAANLSALKPIELSVEAPTVAVVPEPSTWASLLCGVSLLACWQLRKRSVGRTAIQCPYEMQDT